MPTSHNPFAPHGKAPKASEAPEKVEETEEPAETVEEAQGVPQGSAAEVLEWVGEDKDRAKEALDAEEEGQQRIGLSRKLRELLESE